MSEPRAQVVSRVRASLCALLWVVLSTPSARAQSTWHVRADAPPGGDGTSWASAFAGLDEALAALQPFDRVWVAAGTYRPGVPVDPTDPRSATFLVPAAVSLYGGFAGHEATLDERAGLFDETVLSGDLGRQGERSDDAYNVVRTVNPSGVPPGPVRIDGFTVRDGNADGAGLDSTGGGVNGFNQFLVLSDVTLRENNALSGGGVFAQPGVLWLTRCRFLDNTAEVRGGGLHGQALALRAYGCVFARNRARHRGGAVNLVSIAQVQSALLANCVFHDNSAARGGALHLPGGSFSSGKAWLAGCTLAFNGAALEGGALWLQGEVTYPGTALLSNSIVWGNRAPLGPQVFGRAAAVRCDVEGGGFTAAGNFAAPPLFVDAAARDLRLAPGSPCIDAGWESAIAPDLLDLDGDGVLQEPVPFDAAGWRRLRDDPRAPDTGLGGPPVVDLGAYER